MFEGNHFALEQIAKSIHKERLCEAKINQLLKQLHTHKIGLQHRVFATVENLLDSLHRKPRPQLKVIEQQKICCDQ
ncbi:hypothetical protein HYR54_13090 [Candidatus Acetothermia bacterium]|nr:hypothetical protein [Candidatus Acetothermia bacterium]MBI3659530.1 hypothetical protein [Candidatus Acetothermia bacterium]